MSPVPEGERTVFTSKALTALTVMVGLAATISLLVLAKHILLPITIAFLSYLLLRPAVRVMGRLHVPAPLGAAVAICLFISLIVVGTVIAAGPAWTWTERLAGSASELKERLSVLRGPVSQLNELAETVEAATTAESDDRTLEVAVRQETWDRQALSLIQVWGSDLAFAAIIAFFMLGAGDHLPRKIADACALNRRRNLDHCHELGDPRAGVCAVVDECERSMSRYLMLTTTINALLGACVAGTCWLSGMPNPMLWGILAAILNFVPYFGAIVGIVILGIAGLITFDSLLDGLTPALLYFAVNVIESEVVTPFALRRHFTLDPIVTVVWTAVWLLIWGIPGAILAVPLLMLLVIVFRHVPALAPICALISH